MSIRGTTGAVALLMVMLLASSGCSNGTADSPSSDGSGPAQTGTSAPPAASGLKVSGTANFSARDPLPDDSVLVVKVVDASSADSATAAIGETTVTAGGMKAPIAFEVPYDDSRVNPTGLYYLQAEITSKGTVLLRHEGELDGGDHAGPPDGRRRRGAQGAVAGRPGGARTAYPSSAALCARLPAVRGGPGCACARSSTSRIPTSTAIARPSTSPGVGAFVANSTIAAITTIATSSARR